MIFRAGKSMYKALGYILVILPLLFAFNNCSAPTDSLISTSKSKSNSMGTDGEGFEGKLSRFVPGHSCGDINAEYASLESRDGKTLSHTLNSGSGCAQKSQISFADLYMSSNTKDIAAYKEGIYVAPILSSYNNGRNPIFTEAWCYIKSEKGHSKDFVLQWSRQSKHHLLTTFSSDGSVEYRKSIHRELSQNRVTYENTTLKIEIDLNNVNLLKPHEIEASVNIERAQIYCRMGGQFDPVVPEDIYPSSSVLVIDEPVEPIVPNLSGNVISYSLEKDYDLPQGLIFDSNTGTISGLPTEEMGLQTIIINAEFTYGRISVATDIGVGPRIDVNTNEFYDFETCVDPNGLCDLKSAVMNANTIAPVPATIYLPALTFYPNGHVFEINGYIRIVGDQRNTISAEQKGRLFVLNRGSRLWLDNLTLKGGAFHGPGGAIYANGAFLGVNNVHFKENRVLLEDDNSDFVNENNQGGAVAAFDTSVKIRNSEFSQNKSTVGGTSPMGGAFYQGDSVHLTIEDTVFYKNEALMGGAIALDNVQMAKIKNVDFIENSSSFDGGAIYIYRGTQLLVSHSRFFDNESLLNGGALMANAYNYVLLKNSIFDRNVANRGLAIYLEPRDGANNSRFELISSKVLNSKLQTKLTSKSQGESIYLFDFGIVENEEFLELYKKFEFFKAPTYYIKDSIINDGPDISNCAKYNTKYNLYFLKDLGGNSFDDDSCVPVDENQL